MIVNSNSKYSYFCSPIIQYLKILRIKFGGESSKNLKKLINYILRKMYAHNYRHIISGCFSQALRNPSKELLGVNESQDKRA